MPPVEPDNAERFEVLEVLGQGSFSTVFRAFDRNTRGVVALKRLDGADRKDLVDLQVEFQLLSSLHHAGLVQVDELTEWNGHLTLVMEWVDGRSLDEVFLDTTTFLALVLPLVDALAHLHEQGIVHGDVKPANVLVKDNRAVLVDLGFATEDTRESLGGTPFYFSPERFLGAPASLAADVYALGVTLAEGLTTDPVALESALFSRHQGKEEALPLGGPEALRDVVDRMVSAQPDARPTLREVLAEIGRWQGAEPLQPLQQLPEALVSWLDGDGRCAELRADRATAASLSGSLHRWCSQQGRELFRSRCVLGRRFTALEGLVLRARLPALGEASGLLSLLQAFEDSPRARDLPPSIGALAQSLVSLLMQGEVSPFILLEGFQNSDADSVVLLGELLARAPLRVLLLTEDEVPSGSPAAAFVREWGAPSIAGFATPAAQVDLPEQVLMAWGVLGATRAPLPLAQALCLFEDFDAWRGLRLLERSGCVVRRATRQGELVFLLRRAPQVPVEIVRKRLDRLQSDDPLVRVALARLSGDRESEGRALVEATEHSLAKLAYRQAHAQLKRLRELRIEHPPVFQLEAQALVGVGHWEAGGRAWLATADQSGSMTHRLRGAEVLIGAGLLEDGEAALQQVLAGQGLPKSREGMRALVQTLWDRLAMRIGWRSRRTTQDALNAAFVGTGVLSYFDSVAGFGLQTHYLRLAMDSRDPVHRARALHQELVWQASRNDPSKVARATVAFEAAYVHPEAAADAYHATLSAFACFLEGNFVGALEAFRTAGLRAELEGRMTWERDFCTVHSAVCLEFLGRREELAGLVARNEQGDPAGRTPVRQAWQDLGAAYVLDLAADQPEAALERIERAQRAFGGRARMFSYLAMVARARVALYRRAPHDVFEALHAERWTLRLLGPSNQSVRVMAAWLEGLACCLLPTTTKVLRRLHRCARRLEADQACFAPGLAPSLRAAYLARAGQLHTATELRKQAASLHRERGLTPFAQALDLESPHSGDIVAPTAWATIYAPTFPGGST